MAINYSLQ